MRDQPELSIIIAVVSGANHLKRCLESLRKQENSSQLEIIVPDDGSDPEIVALSKEFPEVNFLHMDNLHFKVSHDGSSREHLDELRARGVLATKGKIVALLEDHCRADSAWAHALIKMHEQPYPAIGGSVENEVDQVLNWAVYFSDFIRYQNPLREGPVHYLTDVNVSYKRDALEEMRNVWQASFHENVVNDWFWKNGKTLWLAPQAIVFQHRGNLTLKRALKERYVWGRSFAGMRVQDASIFHRVLFVGFSPFLPVLLLARKTRTILQKKRLLSEFMKAFPYLVLLTIFWSVGEFVGYWTGKAVSAK